MVVIALEQTRLHQGPPLRIPLEGDHIREIIRWRTDPITSAKVNQMRAAQYGIPGMKKIPEMGITMYQGVMMSYSQPARPERRHEIQGTVIYCSPVWRKSISEFVGQPGESPLQLTDDFIHSDHVKKFADRTSQTRVSPSEYVELSQRLNAQLAKLPGRRDGYFRLKVGWRQIFHQYV